MRHTSTQNGFTLIEMLSVFAIFTVLTSITLFNYGKFRSETILTNMAYEVALSIREAQIYGVSARKTTTGTTASYDNPHGIYVRKGSGQYYLFADTNPVGGNGEFDGNNCLLAGGDTCITPYTMQQNIIISDIKAKVSSGNSSNCQQNISDISIVFRRPNPEPQILGSSLSNTPSFVELTILAPNNSVRYVLIYNNGQISVVNSPKCTN